MRNISDTLLNTQKQASHIPYVKLEAQNKINGVTRLDWKDCTAETKRNIFML